MRLCTEAKVILVAAVFVTSEFGAFCFAKEKDYSPFPNPDAGYVTDLANLLTDQQEEQLERLLYTAEEKKGVEIVVVTIDSMKDYSGTPNRTIEEFARALFNAYRIGNMPKNDGILFLVALKDRKARIELGAGYRHRRDSDARRIMDKEVLPSLRKDRYAEGIIKGTKSLAREFAHMSFIPAWILILVVITAIVALTLIAISLFKHGKRGWGWVCVGLLIVALLALLWLVGNLLKASAAGGGGGGGSGGGGSGGGGGASGSF